jgi:hypothetical protein
VTKPKDLTQRSSRRKETGSSRLSRHLAYIVFKDMPLEDFGNRIPQITAEITRNPDLVAPYVNCCRHRTPRQPRRLRGRAEEAWTGLMTGSVSWFSIRQPETITSSTMICGRCRNFIAFKCNPSQAVRTSLILTSMVRSTLSPPSIQPFRLAETTSSPTRRLFNSGSGQIWDANSGAGLGRIGHPSNGFPANPLPDTSQPFYPEGALIGTWDATALWLPDAQ